MEKGEGMKLLETVGLTMSFGGLVALDDVNFSVGKGELRGKRHFLMSLQDTSSQQRERHSLTEKI